MEAPRSDSVEQWSTPYGHGPVALSSGSIYVTALIMVLVCVCAALLIQILPTPGRLAIQRSS